MSGAPYEFPQTCKECEGCKNYRIACPGLIHFSEAGCQDQKERWGINGDTSMLHIN